MKVSTIKGWYKEYAKSCETVAKFLANKLKVKPNSKITELVVVKEHLLSH